MLFSKEWQLVLNLNYLIAHVLISHQPNSICLAEILY